jgi:Domain of unknown function (DUF1937)
MTGNGSSLAYLATPYSKYPTGPHGAFFDAARLAGKLLLAGVNVYSPIAHTHPIGLYSGMDILDLKIWLPVDELMMERCDILIVARMAGWETSSGIAHEIEFFERAGKPIFDLDPDTMKMVKRGIGGFDYQFGLTDDQIRHLTVKAEAYRDEILGTKFERLGT